MDKKATKLKRLKTLASAKDSDKSLALLAEINDLDDKIDEKVNSLHPFNDLKRIKIRGANGKDGLPGKDGENGKDGQQGPIGPQGIPGINGKNGTDGLDGRDGLDGKDGKDGVKGDKGDKGDKGEDATLSEELKKQINRIPDIENLAKQNAFNPTMGPSFSDLKTKLSTVTTDSTLTGNGTSTSPLGVSASGTVKSFVTVGFNTADYIVDGVADEVQINQAIQDVNTAGGGTVFIKAGNYSLSSTIVLNHSNIVLMGAGMATNLKTANGSNADGITCSGTGTNNYQIKMLHIDCNRSNNTFGAGITLNTPYGSRDAQCTIEDVGIEHCANNGIQFTANADVRVALLTRVDIKDCLGNGVYMPLPSSTDNIFDSVICDTIALNGLYIAGANSHFLNCKMFYCGSAGGNNHGFYVAEYNNYFENCEAQDNYQSGFYIDGSVDSVYGTKGCTFVNCIADSNNQNANASYGAGFQFSNANNSTIVGGITVTRPYPTFTQHYGVRFTGTSTGNNVIGLFFDGNTVAWADTSSGSNYRSLCTGQSTEASTIPGNLNMGANQLIIGTGTAYLGGASTTRMLINGGGQPIELDNFTQVFMNSATPTIDMYNASDRTLVVQNGGGGGAYIQPGTAFKAADGSAGISTTITSAGLVGKTITIKNGIITGFS